MKALRTEAAVQICSSEAVFERCSCSSHRKSLKQWTLLLQAVVIVDTTFWHGAKNLSEMSLFIANNPYFLWGNKKNCYSLFKCFYLILFSTFTLSELSNFSKAFVSQVVTLKSLYKIQSSGVSKPLNFHVNYFSQNCLKHVEFTKFTSHVNFLETRIQRILCYSGNFLKEPQVSAVDRFDCQSINNLQIDILHKKMKFSIKCFFSKCDRIRIFLRIWSHLLKTSFKENFIFCAVTVSWYRLVLSQVKLSMISD